MTKTLKLGEIRLDGGTQTRIALNADVAKEYSEKLKDLPPVDVWFDGEEYWLADGFHRLEAHRLAGKKSLKCNIHEGSLRDAILWSAGANANHGLRRTNEEKRKAVTKLLHDDEWRAKSDRWIGRHCGVSYELVGVVRAELYPPAGTVSSDSPEPTARRESSDGAVRPLPKKRRSKTAKLGSEPEAQGEQYDEDGNLVTGGAGGDMESCPECRTLYPEGGECPNRAEHDEAAAPALHAPPQHGEGALLDHGAELDESLQGAEQGPSDPSGANGPAEPQDRPLHAVRVPTRVDMPEHELLALDAVTEPDADLQAAKIDKWQESKPVHNVGIESDARAAVGRLGVRFGAEP